MFGKKSESGRPPETGDQEEAGEDARGKGGEGARNAETTAKLASAANPGQTSHPAPADDVGVPSDEEISDEKRSGSEA